MAWSQTAPWVVLLLTTLPRSVFPCDSAITKRIQGQMLSKRDTQEFFAFMKGTFVDLWIATNNDERTCSWTDGSGSSSNAQLTHFTVGSKESKPLKVGPLAFKTSWFGQNLKEREDEVLSSIDNYNLYPLFLDQVTGIVAYYKCTSDYDGPPGNFMGYPVPGNTWFTVIAMKKDNIGAMKINSTFKDKVIKAGQQALAKVKSLNIYIDQGAPFREVCWSRL